jgi:hypothetical protein
LRSSSWPSSKISLLSSSPSVCLMTLRHICLRKGAPNEKGGERSRSRQRHQTIRVRHRHGVRMEVITQYGNSRRTGGYQTPLDAVLLWQTSGKDKFVTVEVTFYLRYLSARRKDSSEAATATQIDTRDCAVAHAPFDDIFFSHPLFLSSPGWQAATPYAEMQARAKGQPSRTPYISVKWITLTQRALICS